MKLIFAILLLLIVSCKKETRIEEIRESTPPILRENQQKVNNVVHGFYSALPEYYDQLGKQYPLLLFIHGAGQYGSGGEDLKMVLRESIPELIDNELFPASFNVNGNNFSFIVLIPQFSREPATEDIFSFMAYALKNFRVDASRIYIVGMSEGAEATINFASEYAPRVAAIVPMAGVPRFGDITGTSKKLADGKLPIWFFHNLGDEVIGIHYAEKFINLLNSFQPSIVPRFTRLQTFGLFGHDAWTKASDPRYREEGKNIYEWMLQYHR